MKNFVLSVAVVLFGFSFANVSTNRNNNLMADNAFFVQELKESTFDKSRISIDSTTVYRFFKKYNNLKKYKSDVIALYKKRNYNSIWYDHEGLIEFANLLYSKVNLLEEEGLK